MVISYLELEVFLLILARIIGIFIMAPLFSARGFPTSAKVAFGIWLAGILWFIIPVDLTILPSTTISLFSSLITEVAIGFIIGFIANLIFIAIQGAGEIMDLQMGLSVASAFDPVFGATISIIGRLSFYIALTIFLLADGHHMLLSAFNQSFKLFPPGAHLNFSSPMLAGAIASVLTNFWVIALKLSGPIVLMIFLSDFAFGIVSRVAPQVNVFQLGFQVKPSLGLLGLLFILPLLVKYIGNLVGTMAEEVFKILMVLR